MQDHSYNASNKTQFLSFVSFKNRGGLVLPSSGVVKVLKVCENIFKLYIIDKSNINRNHFNSTNLMCKMLYHVKQQLAYKIYNIFPDLIAHDTDNDIGSESQHSGQLFLGISRKYFNMRLKRYGQQFTKDVIHKNKLGLCQKLTKTILFQGL